MDSFKIFLRCRPPSSFAIFADKAAPNPSSLRNTIRAPDNVIFD